MKTIALNLLFAALMGVAHAQIEFHCTMTLPNASVCTMGHGHTGPPLKPGGETRVFGKWEAIAAEGQLMTFKERTTVRIYSTGLSHEKTVEPGEYVCNPRTFGWVAYAPHECHRKVGEITVSELAAQETGRPYVDPRLGVPKAIGYTEPRIKQGPMPQPGAPAFRLNCDFGASHMSFDDPIVYPGQPGKAHHHTFFGNTSINAHTTIPTIGTATCFGGTVNLSGYWVPSIIDTRFGRPIALSAAMVYYKAGHGYIPITEIKPPPVGLRMISGDMHATTEANAEHQFACRRADDTFYGNENYNNRKLLACAVGERLVLSLQFPQCWDGKNLDSADHKSHMAHAERSGCPASHPIGIPSIAFIVQWPVLPGDDTTKWRLSSDSYAWSSPAGYSLHGDWLNGWDPKIIEQIVVKCLNEGMECGASLIGAGEELY